MSSALQKQREHYEAVRARLMGPAQGANVVRMKNPQNAPKPLMKFHRWLKANAPKWIEPRYVYLQPIGPLQPPTDLRVVLAPDQPNVITAKHIVDGVCAAHGVSRAEVLSLRRTKHVVAARHEIMWRLRKETSWSFPQIGRFLGDRDHTTILVGVRRHEQRMREAGQ